jgi:hypothetical protein
MRSYLARRAGGVSVKQLTLRGDPVEYQIGCPYCPKIFDLHHDETHVYMQSFWIHIAQKHADEIKAEVP